MKDSQLECNGWSCDHRESEFSNLDELEEESTKTIKDNRKSGKNSTMNKLQNMVINLNNTLRIQTKQKQWYIDILNVPFSFFKISHGIELQQVLVGENVHTHSITWLNCHLKDSA